MNAFNRFVMLIVALLLIVVPVLMLLVAFGVLSASLINQYTNYQGAVNFFSNLSPSSLGPQTGVIVGIAGIILALVALLLLMRELTFGQRLARSTLIDDSPGQETRITSKAVKALSEGAARDAGAASPSVSLASKGRPYLVSCKIEVPEEGNYTEVATRTRDNIRQSLEGQGVPVKNVEVTVQGTAS